MYDCELYSYPQHHIYLCEWRGVGLQGKESLAEIRSLRVKGKNTVFQTEFGFGAGIRFHIYLKLRVFLLGTKSGILETGWIDSIRKANNFQKI